MHRIPTSIGIFSHFLNFATEPKGLLYDDQGLVKSVKVSVIDTLEVDDIYDFIFVTVRYDKTESALIALKHNRSKTIVTMSSNSSGFSSWQAIIGQRLLPAFPGLGGQIKDGVLFPRIPPKLLAATRFGEIDGILTKRVTNLAALFDTTKLSYKVTDDMNSYLITHAVSDIAMLGALATDNQMSHKPSIRRRQQAHQITTTLKKYLQEIKEAGVVISPAVFSLAPKLPNWLLNSLFSMWLGTDMVKDMMLPEYANSATNEIRQLEDDLVLYLRQHQDKNS